MGHTTHSLATALLTQDLLAGSGGEVANLFTAGLALLAVGVLFTALRRVAQVVAALAAAAAAVGSVFLLVVVFIGLLAAALVLNTPL